MYDYNIKLDIGSVSLLSAYIFFILKCTNNIDFSWWWILGILFGYQLLVLTLIIIAIIISIPLIAIGMFL